MATDQAANRSQPTVNPELRAIEQQHKRETLMVNARPLLARLFLGAWIAVDVLLVLFFALSVIVYLVSGSFTEVRQAAALGDNVAVMHVYSEQRAAEDLVINSPHVLSSTDGAYDLYATVENPNALWYAQFTYTFWWESGETEAYEGFVMPGEEKYLLALNVKSASKPGTARMVIDGLAWHSVDRHDVPDPELWLADHRNFLVDDASHAVDVELAEDRVARSLFTITNETPYSYWEPTFTVILERNGSVVGVHQATVSQFATGETRQVEVHWSGELVSSGTPVVYPNINYFSPDAYMTPSGDQVTDLRDVFEGRR